MNWRSHVVHVCLTIGLLLALLAAIVHLGRR